MMKDSHDLALLNIFVLSWVEYFYLALQEARDGVGGGGGVASVGGEAPLCFFFLVTMNRKFYVLFAISASKIFLSYEGILCFPIATGNLVQKRGTLLSTMSVYTNFIINLGNVWTGTGMSFAESLTEILRRRQILEGFWELGAYHKLCALCRGRKSQIKTE